MRHKISFMLTAPFLIVGCIDNTPPKPQQIVAASCPATPVSVLKVSYSEAKGKYLIFHTTSPKGEKIANPLSVENLQMAQLETPKGSSGDSARLNFQNIDGKCNPILEMTQGFKIELAAASNGGNSNSGEGGGHSSSGGGSYWAPFLMGALVGNAVSSAMQPRHAPAYYLPPPASTAGANGLVTGGVSGKTPDDLNKKYESQYKQPAKKGFFSKKDSSVSSHNDSPKKRGFFSDGNRSKSGSSGKKSGGFFRKR